MATAVAVKEAAPAATSAILSTWSNAVEESEYISDVTKKLHALGFNRDNSIAFLSICRDEASRVLDREIAQHWSQVFNLHAIAGVPTTALGLAAGASHSPQDEKDGNKERYVFFGYTHTGVDETGTIGQLRRAGRPLLSNACGALVYLAGVFAESKELGEIDPLDHELYELRRKLLAKDPKATVVDVTNAAAEVVTETLEAIIAKVVDTSKADYAVITGIEIHTGNNPIDSPFDPSNVVEYIVPSSAYAVVSGEKQDL